MSGSNILQDISNLRKEKQHLMDELGSLVIGEHEYDSAKDGVDYKYMRAVRIQSIEREIKRLVSENMKAVK